MRTIFHFFIALILLSASCSLNAAEKTVGQNDHLYNARYGEIIVVTGGPFNFTGHVYNTIGLSDCPEADWKALDASQLKKQYHARAVTLNGPRYFLMDEASALHSGKIKTFGTLQARHLANLKISLSTILKGGAEPYTDNVVLRSTSYLFKKGRTIYELTTPNGMVYVMQSYPQQNDPNFVEADLAKIASRLKLPPGWHFNARKLDEDFVMKITGKAYVLRDSLQNSYQRE